MNHDVGLMPGEARFDPCGIEKIGLFESGTVYERGAQRTFSRMLDIMGPGIGPESVQNDDAMPECMKPIAKISAYESGAAGYKDLGHRRAP